MFFLVSPTMENEKFNSLVSEGGNKSNKHLDLPYKSWAKCS